jgi:tRNA 2-thiouridine synthesizing protein E
MALAHKRELNLLPDGRLANLADWSEDVAQQLAAREGLTLTADHWEVINAMREYYQQFNISPVMKLLLRNLALRSHAGRYTELHLAALFPAGVLIQGSRIAGVPVPYLDVELERKTYQGKATPVTHLTRSIEFEGETYHLSPTGNLLDTRRWNARLAAHLARQEGIELTADHWEVLNFLREFYFTYGISPMVMILMKYMAEDLGPGKASREHLYALFPKGPSRQGSRIAGLPEPQGCIDPGE